MVSKIERWKQESFGYTFRGRDGVWEAQYFDNPSRIRPAIIIAPSGSVYDPDKLFFGDCSFCEDDDPEEWCLHEADLLKEERRANAFRIILERTERFTLESYSGE